MAESPAPASGDESFSYGGMKDVRKALDGFLQQRQGRTVTRKKRANSSAGRARRNVIGATSPAELLKELLRRARKERRRQWRREYMREWREKKRSKSN